MKTKINYKNVLKLVILIFCLGVIIHDMYMLLIYPLISKTLTQFTLYGFLTFVLSIHISLNIFYQIKNVSNTGTVKHTDK
jgi:hypothetical protein